MRKALLAACSATVPLANRPRPVLRKRFRKWLMCLAPSLRAFLLPLLQTIRLPTFKTPITY